MRTLRPLALILALVLTGCSGSSPGAGDAAADASAVRAFVHARIFDGTGVLVEDGVVLVRDGIVERVGSRDEVAVPEGTERIDLEGRWLLPGLINAHGHVNDGGDRPSIPEQLEIYAHYGVTTVLSLGDDGEHMRHERWSPDLRRARLFVSGPSLNPGSAQEAAEEVARVAAMEVDWVKMHVSGGRGREHYPAVIAAARERELPAAIHIEELEDARGVVRAGATLVAHSVRDRPVDPELIDLMLERNVCLVPTFTRELSTFVYAERPDFFDDPFFLERSAPEDLEAWLTPERRAQAESPQAQYWKEALPLAMENMRRLHEAGVGIAMGTDTGPAGRFQGYFEHLELDMMVEAGLTPEEVLVAATAGAARCIGLDDRVGSVAPGLWADFLVVDGNPLGDIRDTRRIHGVWIAGNRIR